MDAKGIGIGIGIGNAKGLQLKMTFYFLVQTGIQWILFLAQMGYTLDSLNI